MAGIVLFVHKAHLDRASADGVIPFSTAIAGVSAQGEQNAGFTTLSYTRPFANSTADELRISNATNTFVLD